MKTSKKYMAAIVAALLVCSSCNKYLDVQPKGKQILNTVNDYDKWLNAIDLESTVPNELDQFADNVDRLDILSTIVDEWRPYLWFEQFSNNVTLWPVIWGRHYKTIYLFNTVIQHVDAAVLGTTQQKASLKAEALLGRAMEYLYLVNEYGKPYDAATSSTDLAVPFVISNDLQSAIPQRSTVQQIYDHIIADINTAIPNLPTNNAQNRFRGSVAGAYSMLARTYLLMRNYAAAKTNAELALSKGNSVMIDYNTGGAGTILGSLFFRKDAIYARYEVNFGAMVPPVAGFYNSMDTGDIRKTFWYYTYIATRDGTPAYVPFLYGAYPNVGTSVSEMRLIIAEVAARSGDLPTALAQLNQVRQARISTANYTAFASANQETVLQRVFTERNFEMPFHAIRWFDMRRLNKEGRMGTVTRRNQAGAIIATLEPSSPRYTLQIPLQEKYYQPDWPQNP